MFIKFLNLIKLDEAGAGSGGGTGTGGEAAAGWTEGMDEGTVAYLGNKGWTGAGDVVEGYRNLEKLYGADKAGNTVAIPQDKTDKSAMDVFYNKLGRPVEAKGYTFQVGDSSEDKALSEWSRNTFHELGLTLDQGNAVADQFSAFTLATKEAGDKAYTEELQGEGVELQKVWGARHEANVALAQRAANQFGIDRDTVNTMQSVMGYSKVMQVLADIGTALGEDDAEGGSGGGGSDFNALTPAQAQAQIVELNGDKAYGQASNDRMHPGHKAAVARMSRLMSFAYPD